MIRRPGLSLALAITLTVLVAATAAAQAAGSAVLTPRLPGCEARQAAVNGIELYYETCGHGEPVLLLHGFLNNGEFWRPFVPELAATFRLLVVDLRGHGRSTNSTDTFTHRQAAMDVFALLDSLGIKTVQGVGHSSGGMTLLHMATQQPSRMTAIVPVGATHYFPEQARERLRRQKVELEGVSPDYLKRMRAMHERGDAQVVALRRQFRAFGESYDDMNFTTPYLGTITARTLIIHGDRDAFFPVAIPVEMYRSIPKAWLWLIPNGTHWPVPGHQREFVATLVDFLSGKWEKPAAAGDDR